MTHYIHDIFGNVIAETGGGGSTGATGTLREYIWLPETEIAPTRGSRTTVDRPLAVVEDVETASPLLWYVHVDHLHRPVKMTTSTKASVWDAVWLPWGNSYSITGTAAFNARLPGQWFQIEAGLHYNWHRSYDPTIGRYTQPDPLGFVDGPSVYGYGRASPQRYVDPRGQAIPAIIAGICARNPQACRALITATALTIYNYLYPSKKGGCPVFNSESAPPNDNTAPPPSSGPPTTENPPARPPIDINDPETLKDRTPNEVRDALNGNPNLTGPTPTRDGNGERWTVNGRPGEQVIINNGYPEGLAGGGGDGTHRGPYIRISVGGAIIRIPLR